mmetsp:Transcript_16568/g.32692  ORF Transcript_16568/g.32692 Transcript_16568/m.32692 type:complete len:259 (-) Transcript_16568:564-1340(-)
MPRDQHSLAGHRAHVHLGGLGGAEGGVCLVEDLHGAEVDLAGAEAELEHGAQVVARLGAQRRQGLVDEVVDHRVLLARHARVVRVRRDPLEAVQEHLDQTHGVGVLGGEALLHDGGDGGDGGGGGAGQGLELRGEGLRLRHELADRAGVVVDVGEGGEEAEEHELVDLLGDLLAGHAEGVRVVGQLCHVLHHLVLKHGRLGGLLARARRDPALLLVLRALVAEHLGLVHVEVLAEGGEVGLSRVGRDVGLLPEHAGGR